MKSLFSICLLFTSVVFAAPGGDIQDSKDKTSCVTHLITSTSLCTIPTTTYKLSTVYVPVVTKTASTIIEAKTFTTKSIKPITTSYAKVITTWITTVSNAEYPVTYTTKYTKTTEVPYTTSKASVSTCPVVTNIVKTTSVVSTQTTCYPKPTY